MLYDDQDVGSVEELQFRLKISTTSCEPTYVLVDMILEPSVRAPDCQTGFDQDQMSGTETPSNIQVAPLCTVVVERARTESAIATLYNEIIAKQKVLD